MGPAAEVELVVDHVGAAQLLVLGVGLVHLAGVYLGLDAGVLKAAHARALDPEREAEPEGVAVAGPRDVESRLQLFAWKHIGLPAQLERVETDWWVQARALAVGEREDVRGR